MQPSPHLYYIIFHFILSLHSCQFCNTCIPTVIVNMQPLRIIEPFTMQHFPSLPLVACWWRAPLDAWNTSPVQQLSTHSLVSTTLNQHWSGAWKLAFHSSLLQHFISSSHLFFLSTPLPLSSSSLLCFLFNLDVVISSFPARMMPRGVCFVQSSSTVGMCYC